MDDADHVPAFLLSPDTDRESSLLMPGAHGSVSGLYRMATLDALTDIIRACPDDDVLADAAITQFWSAQDRAGGFLVMFRDSRDAAGQA